MQFMAGLELDMETSGLVAGQVQLRGLDPLVQVSSAVQLIVLEDCLLFSFK